MWNLIPWVCVVECAGAVCWCGNAWTRRDETIGLCYFLWATSAGERDGRRNGGGAVS
jgi:hypothetical protein